MKILHIITINFNPIRILQNPHLLTSIFTFRDYCLENEQVKFVLFLFQEAANFCKNAPILQIARTKVKVPAGKIPMLAP